MNLRFYMPTRVVMEEDCVTRNAALLAPLGHRALVVTGRHSARACGALDDITSALEHNGQTMVLFDQVKANPTVDCVYEGAALVKESGADFVVAIGGGSPMDAGKAIAMVAAENRQVEALFAGGYEKRLPLCCIPTTAGTGSEVTQYSILTNDAAQTKTSLAAPALFPDLALLDAKYLKAVPRATMVHTVVDSLSHSVEGYLSVKASPITDALALEALENIGALLAPLEEDRLTDGDRAKLLYASTLGGMVIAHTGTTAVHAMGYSLTYFKHIDHGRANGLLMPDFLSWAAHTIPQRVQTAVAALGFAEVSGFSAALESLLGQRETLTGEEAKQFAALAIQTGNIHNCAAEPNEEDLLNIYRAAFRLKEREGEPV